MRKYEYSLVDVFTEQLFGGNQLAVFKNAEHLSGVEMQNIAKELNLSETTFVTDLGPNHKKVRIFTPKIELPMAGHPTIGTAFVLADECVIKTGEGNNELIFREGIGEIKVSIQIKNGKIGLIDMAQPTPVFGPIFKDTQKIAGLLSIDQADINTAIPAQTVSTGVPFLFVPLNSMSAIQKIKIRMDIWEQDFRTNERTQNIFVFTRETVHAQSTVHSRMFAPALGIAEDPATGAASGPLGAYLAEYGIATQSDDGKYHIISEQGMEIGRPSVIRICIGKTHQNFSEVRVGGTCVKVGTGSLYLPD